ncbi:MAG: hypothetical protein NTY53_18845 [Kiritimatiellaeota bacterium]|nr:hypothetical protein [Kiritimatiellota bacterium]
MRMVIRQSSNSMACWIELESLWPEATTSTQKNIMEYSHWCWNQGGDVATAAACAFIEHVTEREENWPLFLQWYDDNAIRALMPLWQYNYRDQADAFMNRLLAARRQPV